MNDSEPQSYVSALIPPSLRERLEESAREHDRSLSGELSDALRAYLAEPDQRERITRSGRGGRRGGGLTLDQR